MLVATNFASFIEFHAFHENKLYKLHPLKCRNEASQRLYHGWDRGVIVPLRRKEKEISKTLSPTNHLEVFTITKFYLRFAISWHIKKRVTAGPPSFGDQA
jgi:hypothetical protein